MPLERRPRLDAPAIRGHTPATFRTVTLLTLVFVTSLVSGCATVAVSRDYAPHVDFAAYRTYALRSGQTREGEPRSLIDQRAQAAVDHALTRKGLRRANGSESPDLLVIVRFDTRERLEGVPYMSAYGTYWNPAGPWGYSDWGYGWNAWMQHYTEATLVLDLVDARSNDVVWRGRARRAAADPELSASQVAEMVTRLLDDFPPGSAKK